MKQRRRVELNKLHVGDLRPRPPGHRDPVAGRNRRVGGELVHLPRAAGRQQSRRGDKCFHTVIRFVQDIRPAAAAFFDNQINNIVMLQHRDVRVRPGRFHQRPLDFLACEVRRVDDPPPGMPAFTPQRQFPVLFPVEVRAERHQLAYPVRSFVHQDPHRVLMAQPCAGDQRVLNVQLRVVVRAHDPGDAALRPVGIGIRPVLLRDQRDPALCGDFQRKRQPGAAAAQNQKIIRLHCPRFRF